MDAQELLLRRLLWLRHDAEHFAALYGDDGEMQCSACGIDFKRRTAEEISERFRQIGAERLAAARARQDVLKLLGDPGKS